jgi:hypothetical protein
MTRAWLWHPLGGSYMMVLTRQESRSGFSLTRNPIRPMSDQHPVRLKPDLLEFVPCRVNILREAARLVGQFAARAGPPVRVQEAEGRGPVRPKSLSWSRPPPRGGRRSSAGSPSSPTNTAVGRSSSRRAATTSISASRRAGTGRESSRRSRQFGRTGRLRGDDPAGPTVGRRAPTAAADPDPARRGDPPALD